MVVEEFKSEATTIKVDDSYIETKEKDKEILGILISKIMKQIEY